LEKYNNWFRIAIIGLIVGLTSLSVRLYFNFSQELIPGVNGGYYPLQVRSLLTYGHLGFSDMPLLFYLNAFIIKFVSFFGVPVNDNLILNTVKLLDSISIPLLIIPIYRILFLNKLHLLNGFTFAIISFATLSFLPLILTSDLQKNSLAVLFAFFFIQYKLFYLARKELRYIVFSLLFLILTGITHFGTFIFCIFIFSIGMFYFLKLRAIIPSLVLVASALGLVAIIDSTRFLRLVSFWNVMFERPALMNGMIAPPDSINIIISIFLAIWATWVLIKKRELTTHNQKSIIFSYAICLLVFSFPLLDVEYFKRLSLFLFIPQIMIAIQIAVITSKRIKTITISIIVVTIMSFFAVLGNKKSSVISENAYKELKKLKPITDPDRNNTIIIARHGLEWWTAWVLQTKVAQDKAINDNLLNNYKNIIVLNQINGFSEDHERSPFHEPTYPQNSKLIYSSKCFKAFKWTK
jgi:hypothetical protein